MITLVQRVRWARVSVDGKVVGAIQRGLVAFVGVEAGDEDRDADATANKIAHLRVFPDRKPMDLDLVAVGGGCLVISQFTLAAELRHGNRPDFTAAASPDTAEPLYERVAAGLAGLGIAVATGSFGASMQVESCNDGPVSLVLRVAGGKVQGRSQPG